MFVVIFGFPETDRVNNYLLLAQDVRARTGTNQRGINVNSQITWITPIYINSVSNIDY
jgi:hypothetical protein